MIPRLATPILQELARQFRVVTITGPRQSGKTTEAKIVFPEKPYFSLENPHTRELALADPVGFLATLPHGAILDEIQNTPLLLSYVQSIVDEHDQAGEFILTGSTQLDLLTSVTQSLAGRTALFTLLPLSLQELGGAISQWSVDKQLLYGAFPRIYAKELSPILFYEHYISTYVEKDVRHLTQIKDLNLFRKFLLLCAGRVGQLINFSHLANEVGVSHPTIQHWLSILEASYVVFRVLPYYENFGKRVIKSAKLYFTDVGLLSYLLGNRSETHIAANPLRGSLFENLVILEIYKAQLNRGLTGELYFFRDQSGSEIDIILRDGPQLIAVEIKSAQTFTPTFVTQLDRYKQLIGDRFKQGYVIYSGDELQFKGYEVIHYQNAHQVVKG